MDISAKPWSSLKWKPAVLLVCFFVNLKSNPISCWCGTHWKRLNHHKLEWELPGGWHNNILQVDYLKLPIVVQSFPAYIPGGRARPLPGKVPSDITLRRTTDPHIPGLLTGTLLFDCLLHQMHLMPSDIQPSPRKGSGFNLSIAGLVAWPSEHGETDARWCYRQHWLHWPHCRMGKDTLEKC